MAGIDSLKDRILKEAEEAAAKLLSDADKEASDILNRSKERAEARKTAIIESARKTASENADRIVSTAQMQVRNQRLQTMQELIDMVFEKTVDSIKSFDNIKYMNMLYDMILSSTINGDEEIVLSSGDRLKINNEFMLKLNNELKSMGKKGQMVVSDETRDIQGGFILKTKSVEINSTIEAVIRSLSGEIEQEIASILFA